MEKESKVLSETHCIDHYCDSCKRTLKPKSRIGEFIGMTIMVGIIVSSISLVSWLAEKRADAWEVEPTCKYVEEVQGFDPETGEVTEMHRYIHCEDFIEETLLEAK